MINLVTFHFGWNSIHLIVIAHILHSFLGIFSFFLAYGSGQLSILECPDQIKPPKTGRLDGKLIGQVFRACTGHSITESVPLKIELPPFDLAEKVCLINIAGIQDFTSKTLKPKSEIEIYGPENSFETFTNKLYEENALMVTVNLNDGFEAVSFANPTPNLSHLN